MRPATSSARRSRASAASGPEAEITSSVPPVAPSARTSRMLFALALRPFASTRISAAARCRLADERAGRARVQRDVLGQPDERLPAQSLRACLRLLRGPEHPVRVVAGGGHDPAATAPSTRGASATRRRPRSSSPSSPSAAFTARTLLPRSISTTEPEPLRGAAQGLQHAAAVGAERFVGAAADRLDRRRLVPATCPTSSARPCASGALWETMTSPTNPLSDMAAFYNVEHHSTMRT